MPGTRVGIVGARGINNYGGFERVLAGLVPRLVQKGYAVRCSCEKPTRGKPICDEYEGAKLDYFALKPPANYTTRKAFELLYDFFFVLKYALVCDVVLVLGVYGGAALLFPRLLGKEVIVNIDGLEWDRAKYNIVERSVIILYFTLSLHLASTIIIDSRALRRYIGARHLHKVCYVPYGVESQELRPWDEARLWNDTAKRVPEGTIEAGKYWLLVARLEPENNIDTIVKGFAEANTKYPLLVVGDFTSGRYEHRVHEEALNGRVGSVHFLGAIYDSETLWMLRQHCFAYIHGHSVGGTNPSLLEAMISENLIVCHDNPFNRELCSLFANYFSNSRDVSKLITSIENGAEKPSQFRSGVMRRATESYSWEHVVTLYDKLFRGSSHEVGRTLAETRTLGQKREGR